MDAWEYKTCFMGFNSYDNPTYEGYRTEVMTDVQLTELGSEGWELVSVIRLIHQSRHKGSTFWQDEGTWGLQYIFKRPKRNM